MTQNHRNAALFAATLGGLFLLLCGYLYRFLADAELDLDTL